MRNYFVLTFSLLYSHCTCTLSSQLLYSSAWIKHLSIVLKCNVILCLKSQARSLESENISEQGKASVLFSAVMTFSFLFSSSYASHIYAVCLFTACLPEFEMLIISLLPEIFWLFFFSISLSFLLCSHLSVCYTFSMCAFSSGSMIPSVL